MKLKSFVLLIALFLSASVHAQDALTELLRQGLFEEEANLDLQKAMGHYEALIEQSEDRRRIVATALFRLGECYRKLGRNEDAAEQYQRILDRYADQETLRKLSEQNLKALGVTVQDSVTGEEVDPTISEDERRAIAEATQLVQNSPDLINRATTFLNMVSYTRLGIAAHKGFLKLAAFLLENGADPNAYPDNGRTPLSIASERGHLAIVKLLVENGADVNSKGGRDRAPLHETVARRLPQITEYLLEKGADANARIQSESNPGDQRTPLHIAAERGEAELIRNLLNHGADVNARDFTGRTPLIWAAAQGNADTLEQLIDAGCEIDIVDQLTFENHSRTFEFVNPNYPFTAAQGGTALHYSAQKNLLESVKILLANGAKTEVKNGSGQLPIHLVHSVEIAELLIEHNTPLNDAAKAPALKIMAGSAQDFTPLHLAMLHNPNLTDLYLKNGADPSAKDSQGNVPMTWAVLNDRPKAIQSLLTAGGDPNIPGKQDIPPLGWAINFQKAECAKALIEGGADPNGKSVNGSNLKRATGLKNVELVQLLLKAGADPNLRLFNDDPPLNTAIEDESIEIVELLLKHGADPNLQISEKGNALNTLLWNSKNTAIAGLLIEAGVDVNKPNQRLNPPLIRLAEFQMDPALVKKLLSAGADVNTVDTQGNTALHLVLKHKQSEQIVPILLEHGADPNLLSDSGHSSYDLVRQYLEQGRSQSHQINYQMLKNWMERHGAVDLSERKSRIEVRWAIQSDSENRLNDQYLAFSRGPKVAHHKKEIRMIGESPDEYNEFTLLEALNECIKSNGGLPDANLSKIVIQRLYASEPKIEVNLVNLLNNAKPEVQLRWGDIIELKAAKSNVSHSEIARQIQERLARTVQFQCRGETHPVRLVSALGRDPEDPVEYDAEAGVVEIASFWLSEAVENLFPAVFLGANNEATQLYQEVTSMDPIQNRFELSEVTILRSDPQGNLATYEWDLLNRHPDDDLWLRDGDVIQLKLKERPRVVLDSQELRQEEAEELKRLQYLARNSPDLLDPVASGNTPLHNAAIKGYAAVVEFLIKQGVKVDRHSGSHQQTPLHYAAQNGHKAVAELLIENGADVNALDDQKVSALYLAVKEGHRSVVETLLEHGANIDVLSNRKPSNKKEIDVSTATPFMVALSYGRNGIAKLLLEKSPNLDIQGYNEMRAIHYAAKDASAEILNELIDREADVNAQDQEGNSPLIHAARQQPMTEEARLESEKKLQTLIRNGAEVVLKNNLERTALHEAVERSQPQLVDILLEADANPNTVDVNRYSPLLAAIQANDLDSIEMLLSKGADPNFAYHSDRVVSLTCLGWAVYNDQIEAAAMLLQYNADPNLSFERSVPQMTPLHLAAEKNNKEMIQLLLDHGADPNRMDANGKTPLDYLEEMSKSSPSATIMRFSSRNSIRSSNRASSRTVEKTDSQELIALLKEHGANEYVSRQRFIGLGRKDIEFAGEKFQTTMFIESAPTLFEAVALHYASRNYKLDFPDFKNAFIERLEDDKRSIETLPVDIESRVLSGDCSGNIKLEWGDRIVIPEREHPVDEKWAGFSEAFVQPLGQCVSREIDVRLGSESVTIHLVPDLRYNKPTLRNDTSILIDKQHALMRERKSADPGFVSSKLTLKEMIRESGVLKSNSDASRIKLIRPGTNGDAPLEIVVDLNNEASPNPWVQKGDRIVIPDSAR